MQRGFWKLVLVAACSVASITSVAAAAADVNASEDTVTDRANDCLVRGFDAQLLDCRVCDQLVSFLTTQLDLQAATTSEQVLVHKKTAMETITSDCQQCCTDVAQLQDLATTQQHHHVVLEVCSWKFGRYPKVANFVHHHAANHPRLEVQYVNGRHPHLVFFDAEGNKQETVSIAAWDEDAISEFVNAKLKAEDAEAVAAAAIDEGVAEEDEDLLDMEGDEDTSGDAVANGNDEL